MRGFDSLSF